MNSKSLEILSFLFLFFFFREKVNLSKTREELLVDVSLDDLYLKNRIKKLKDIEDEVVKMKQNQREMEDVSLSSI